jgi:hypothetical protein
MKVAYTLIIFCLTISPIFCQDDNPDSTTNEPDEKIDVKKEFDEDGNIIKYDSSYSWSWLGDDFMDDEMLQIFQEKMHELQERMELFEDEFSSKFHFDEDFLKEFEEYHKDFKINFDDSTFCRDHFEEFFNNRDFEFHGFNFDGNNFEIMPFDKEKIEEIEKRMQDLFNGEFDERIRKFIEEHKDEIDEIKYQIRESIPEKRKAI